MVLTVISLMEQELLESQDMVQITMLIQSFGQQVVRWNLLKSLVWVSNEQID